MSRVKRSSGKEYRRLSQAAESDDEVILYSLSPSSSSPSVQPHTSTTEFGNGRYDQSLDLELPEIRRSPRKGRRLPARTRKRNGGLKEVYFSKEARACVVFLLLIAVVVGVVILVSTKLGVYWTPQISEQSSLVTAVPVATPTTQSPTSNNPSGGAPSPPSENPPEEITTEPSESPPEEITTEPSENPPEEITTEPSENPPEEITTEPSENPPEEITTEPPKKEKPTEPPEGGPTEPPRETPVATGEHNETTHLPPGEHNETTHLPPEEHTVVTPTTDEETDNEGSSSGEAAMETTSAAVTIPLANSSEGTAATTTSGHPTPPPPDTTAESPSSHPTPPSPDTTTEPPSSHPTPPPPVLPTSPADSEDIEASTRILWEREFFPALTETTLQLQDMNNDSVTDVLMVEGQGSCDMILRALDGLTGHTAWEVPLHLPYDAFAVKCEVDLNKDDIIDCIAAGRQSGFKAISGADGTTIWDRDPNMAYLRYNFYFPLIVPDLDDDGVPDLINTHGGDSTYSPSERERSPSFLVLISGRTGQQLMERVPVPDGHETYMSPVYLSREEGDDVVLVGTGGETIPGSLWAIGYDSLRTRVLNYRASGGYNHTYTLYTAYINHACIGDITQEEMEGLRPVFDPASFNETRDTKHDKYLNFCHPWGTHTPIWNVYGLCVYRILNTTEKGVILPPVIVEMTGDSQDDLVVSTFDGKTLVINGESGDIVWEVTQAGTESYSIPAPLFYNDDSTPDLLVRINHGVWDDYYNYSTVAILDGRNGDELWHLHSVKTGMMSSLSLASDHLGADAAVFIAVGIIDRETPVIKETDMERRRAVTMAGPGHRPCLESGGSCWLGDGEGGEERERRHNGPHGTPTPDTPTLDEALESPEVDVSGDHGDFAYEDFMDNALAYRDPAGLWDGAGEAFPDPHTNLSAFLSYCGWSERQLSAYLYVLPRDQILTGFTPPLVSHGPVVYFPGTQKRHSSHSDPTHSVDLNSLSPKKIRELRCNHIMSPDMVVASPAIGDLNNDGKLEIVYLIVWGGADSEMGVELPPRFTIYVDTLEDRVKDVFGEEGVQWVKKFLPRGQQPWTRYMGAGGDNTYHKPAHARQDVHMV